MNRQNIFIDNLVQAVSENLLTPKLLIAPSHRVGRQWLDQVALRTGSVVNVKTTSVRRLMTDFASPRLARAKRKIAQKEELLRLVGMAVSGLAGPDRDGGYFASLPPSLVFTDSLLHSLEDLENADIKSGKTLTGKLVTQEKVDEMAALITDFLDAKRKTRLAGFSEIARSALDAAAEMEEDEFPVLLLAASTMEDAIGYERLFLERWPKNLFQVLPEDSTDEPDGEIQVFVADCIANETREVLRRAVAEKMPFDTVETVCFDPGTYISALCQTGMDVFGGKVEELPFTFSGGIPAIFSRPVRLVQAWLRWLRDDVPPDTIADCIEAGLLGVEWQERTPGIAASDLAARIKALPLLPGPEGYRRALGTGDAGVDMNAAEAWLAQTIALIIPRTDDGVRLDFSSRKMLDAVLQLLGFGAENDGKLDAYARLALREGVSAWIDRCDWPGFDAVDWLERFTAGLRVMGMGPQPGKMHVSDGVSGGHSGRRVTFVLGMDEGRCPGSVRQDPVLLDRERRELSRKLPGSAWKRERREHAVQRLFSRLRGTVVFGYSRFDAGSGREAYPSSAFLKFSAAQDDSRAGERNKGKDAAQNKFSGAMKTARPEWEGACLDGRDDWLWSLLAWKRNAFSPGDLAPWFPGLARGAEALAARASHDFSAWDGYVPEAGEDFSGGGWVLSPSQLEGLALSPMDFFFRRGLGVKKPKRWEPEPGRWLAGNERGELLHDLYQKFMEELDRRGEVVEEGHETLLYDMLNQFIEGWRRKAPVRDELAFSRERGHLFEAANIFFVHEVARARRERPVCFEAAVGGAKEDEPPWRRREPVCLDFGVNGVISLEGRIDRVDRLEGHGGLVVWDYKTGKSSSFSRTDPFLGGRHLQPYLYAAMLERALEEAGFPERVREFCYFFPMLRDEGGVISYKREELLEGSEVVGALAGLLRGGCFPFARNGGDVKYSEYLEVYGDVRRLVASAAGKEDEGGYVAAWRALDGGTGADEDDG